VVGAVVGVVRAVVSVIRAIADEDVVDVDWICASSMVVVVKLLMLVVQVIWPTMNVRPSATAMELRMMTILLAWEVVCTPPTCMPLSTKPGRQSTEGYAQGSDLSVDRCTSHELDGNARHNKVFIQVQPS
jgi:hypothetical protein